jgi:undecaprenyl-diphosphatase
MGLTLTAILLGIVEGLTEFVPVSSTGHLILASELFGYDAAQWAMFNVVIQLGAILAVVVQYWKTFWNAGIGVLKLEAEGLRFARNILVAFLPSAVLAVLFKDTIEALLGSTEVVGWALIIGGITILGIEKVAKPGAYVPVSDIPLGKVIGVGLAQCVSMIPGVSRSGATIMGALAMGIDRKTAAEFSFFLAVPTMIGASAFTLFNHGDELMAGSTAVGWDEIAIGFVVSFVVALLSAAGFSP